MIENERAEVVVREPSSLARLMLEIDSQWPTLRFLGFGLYFAWIWLCYDSSQLISPDMMTAGRTDSILLMYLASTATLAFGLILCAVLKDRATRLVEHRSFVCAMAALASLSTAGAGLTSGEGGAAFVAFSLLTGVGTSFVALRLGSMYATLPARQATLCCASSLVVACAAYFVVVGIPHYLGLACMSLLPLLAALTTMTVSEEPRFQVERPSVAQRLPKGFFPRLVAAVVVFSSIVGVTRGFSALTESPEALADGGALVVFCTAVAAVVLYAAVALLGNDFDISRLYYPVVILLVLGITIMPVVSNGLFERRFVGVAYACFTMIMWCLYSHVSNQSGLSPVWVFGLGRGMSAAGNTVGWLLGSRLVEHDLLNPEVATAISIAMVIALLVTSMLVFNDRAIGNVLRQTRSQDAPPSPSPSEAKPAADDGEADARRPGMFSRRCMAVAEKFGLSSRERDVLVLLAKGRTINAIAEELSVSFNTSKSHIRHVYVKTGVHTRQELISLIEETRVDA